MGKSIFRTLANQALTVKQEFFWIANLNKNDVKSFVKDGFWLDVATSWFDATYTNPNNKAQFLQQTLWLNSNIRQDDAPFLNQNATDNGFVFVTNISDKERKSFLDYQQGKVASDNGITFMHYYALIDVIDISWKGVLKNQKPRGDPHVFYVNELLMTEHV